MVLAGGERPSLILFPASPSVPALLMPGPCVFYFRPRPSYGTREFLHALRNKNKTKAKKPVKSGVTLSSRNQVPFWVLLLSWSLSGISPTCTFSPRDFPTPQEWNTLNLMQWESAGTVLSSDGLTFLCLECTGDVDPSGCQFTREAGVCSGRLLRLRPR